MACTAQGFSNRFHFFSFDFVFSFLNIKLNVMGNSMEWDISFFHAIGFSVTRVEGGGRWSAPSQNGVPKLVSSFPGARHTMDK